jgi:hypothetical protein
LTYLSFVCWPFISSSKKRLPVPQAMSPQLVEPAETILLYSHKRLRPGPTQSIWGTSTGSCAMMWPGVGKDTVTHSPTRRSGDLEGVCCVDKKICLLQKSKLYKQRPGNGSSPLEQGVCPGRSGI